MRCQLEIQQTIAALPPDTLFWAKDLPLPECAQSAVSRALRRCKRKAELRLIWPGLYYKPAQGLLGETQPYYGLVLKKLLEGYRHQVSYLTGVNIYTGYGLTTQVSTESVIASDKPHQPGKTLRFGGMKVRFIRSHVREQVPPEHIMLLQLLDALWDIDVLPATSSQQATQVLLGWVRKLSAAQRQALGRYALAYPPQTRALAGLLLETVGKNKRLVLQLQASLSPRIVFPLWLDLETFPTAPAWHFVSANGPRLPHHKPGTRTTF